MNTTTNTRGVSEAMGRAEMLAVIGEARMHMQGRLSTQGAREITDRRLAALEAALSAQNTRGVSEAMVALDRALEAVNAPLITDKANERAAWEAVSVLQSHGATLRAALSAPEPAAQGEAKPTAWRYKLTDGSFQYGTAGHEVRIPRPIVEATPLYTAPPAQPERVPDAETVLTEYVRILVDEHGERESREDRIEAMRLAISKAMLTASPAPSEGGKGDADRIDWMESNARSVSFGKAPQQGYWVHVQGVGYSGGNNRSLRDAIDAAREAQAAEQAPTTGAAR